MQRLANAHDSVVGIANEAVELAAMRHGRSCGTQMAHGIGEWAPHLSLCHCM